jgi:hypothetical protein
LRGKRLTIAIFVRRLPGIFLAGTVAFIKVMHYCLNFLNASIHPLLFGWWLDIWASNMFGATMSQRFKLLFSSPFASTTLHWIVGHTFLHLYTILFILHHKVFIILHMWHRHVNNICSLQFRGLMGIVMSRY